MRSNELKFWGLFKSRLHFLGVGNDGVLLLLGTGGMGRDMLSRIISASRISLSIGLVRVGISFVLGCLIGGASGFFGAAVDMIIQRIIEFLGAILKLPLWMVLSAAVPANWPPIRIYFGITVILSIIGWTGLARTARGKIFQLREEDFVLAALLSGSTNLRVIVGHLLPGFASFLIVVVFSYNFLGDGLRDAADPYK